MFFESWGGFWNMPSCFQMFFDVFKTFRGVKNDSEQKMSFFSTNPLLKTAISWFDFCRYKPLTFWWFQCFFLTNWLSRMGKPLVPVGSTHFSHLGHPTLTSFFTQLQNLIDMSATFNTQRKLRADNSQAPLLSTIIIKPYQDSMDVHVFQITGSKVYRWSFCCCFIFPVLSSKSHYSPFEYIFLNVSLNILFIYSHKTCMFGNFIYSFTQYCCADLPFSNKIDYFWLNNPM